ncbi:alpha/beta fold hydrolase [Actinoplanes flavus]|uniref:alpha/beta fold hydrolase n=1 Tax=Actinoplanes flavus TaxID=2820290 RepID=UPI001EE56E28|nr:alpha/beta hydrolase [Actinoplanes flavus]
MVQIHSTGNGPGIVVVHGGGVTAGIYRRLAAKLADRFTVHLYDRRGRGDAPARTLPYDIQEDIDDLLTVLERTGAHNVLGHSGGGLVALLAARQGPIERLALYDGVVPVDDLFPLAWLDPAREAARAGDIPRALALTTAGINTHSAASRLPLGV